MSARLTRVALVVRDYDEAILWFTGVLGFDLLEDRAMEGSAGQAKRWVTVAPPGGNGPSLVLARAETPEQVAVIGNQAGGRVFLFLHTDRFDADHARLVQRGVTFIRPPETADYGKVAVFRDLYGNLWDLLGPPPAENG